MGLGLFHLLQGERRVVETNQEERDCAIVFSLDLTKHRDLYQALSFLAEEDCRSLGQEVLWIVKEYVQDHLRFLERERMRG